MANIGPGDPIDTARNEVKLQYEDLIKAQRKMSENQGRVKTQIHDGVIGRYGAHTEWIGADTYGETPEDAKRRMDKVAQRETCDDIHVWVEWLEENEWNIGVQTGSSRLSMRIIDGWFWTKPRLSVIWEKKIRVREFINVREGAHELRLDMETYYKQASGLIPRLEDIINRI